MNNIQTYTLLNLISATIAIFIAIISWRRRRVSGGMPLFVLMLSVALWSFFSAFEIVSVTLQDKIFWSKLCYIGTLTAPVFFLILSLDYTDQRKWLSRRNILLLLIVPFLVFLLAITNEYHGLIWNSFTPHPENERILQYGHGPVFWVGVMLYAYICLLLGSFLLLRAAMRLPHTYRLQSAALLLASIFPFAGNIFYIAGFDFLQGIDLTPVSFSITGIILAYALFRYRLLDLVPVARDILIENMHDGVIVLDSQNRLLDINPSALELLGRQRKDLMGCSITAIMGKDLELVEQTDPSAVFVLHIPWGSSGDIILDVNLVPITNRQDECLGRLLTLRDITDQKRIEKELQEANDRLREQISRINKLQLTLREQAIRDPLTGLYNRRFLNEVLEIELARAARENLPVSVIMLDLDRFKDFNDTYGHNAGDEILINLGEMLQKQTRQGDFACRFGGEEFVIVMPGAPLGAALKRGDYWRKYFSENCIYYDGKKLCNTFSAGVATFPLHATSLDALLRAADEALYAAKDAGRNRVMAQTTCQTPVPVH